MLPNKLQNHVIGELKFKTSAKTNIFLAKSLFSKDPQFVPICFRDPRYVLIKAFLSIFCRKSCQNMSSRSNTKTINVLGGGGGFSPTFTWQNLPQSFNLTMLLQAHHTSVVPFDYGHSWLVQSHLTLCRQLS